MKNKFILASLMLLSSQLGMAQDTYDLARLNSSDLNGTARYIGMGGAMGALGGDMSAVSSNPAGLGIFRSNDISATIGLNMLVNGTADKSRASFDQLGAVISTKYSNVGSLRYVNYGFGFKKHKNFFDDYSISDLPYLFSQTYQIADLANIRDQFGDEIPLGKKPPLAQHLINTGIIDNYNEEKLYYGYDSFSKYYSLYQTGGIQEYDFSLAANIEDKYFLGASVGFYHAAFDRGIAYTEYFSDEYSYDMFTCYSTRGSGIDLKLGAIIRPIDNSNFRFGIALHTPTFYSLNDVNGIDVSSYDEFNELIASSEQDAYSYDYQMITPWKFNISLGNTFNNNLALGFEYQYEDFSSIKTRDEDGYLSDFAYCIDGNTKNMLRSVHELKFGAEYKITPKLAVRAGYNYTSSIFYNDDYRDVNYFANSGWDFTETSWENTFDLHRLTCGVGFRGNHLYADMAVQFTLQNADLYAFDDIDMPATEISKNRSQLSFTLGYKF